LISSSLCIAARSLFNAWLNMKVNFVWCCRNLCIQLILKSLFCWLLWSNFIVMNWIWLTHDDQSQKIISSFFFNFFIKCMQSMTMTLSRRCAYVKLHVHWSKSLLYIFSLINHINSLRKQALSTKKLLSLMFSFSCFFMFFSLYSFILNSYFLVAIQVLFKYFSIVILSILMINNVNIMFMFLNCAFALSCNCSAL